MIIYLFIIYYLFVYSFIYLFIYSFIYLFIYLSIYHHSESTRHRLSILLPSCQGGKSPSQAKACTNQG